MSEASARTWAQFQREDRAPSMVATVGEGKVAFVSDRGDDAVAAGARRCVWKIWALDLAGEADSLADGVMAVESAFDEAEAAAAAAAAAAAEAAAAADAADAEAAAAGDGEGS